MRICIPVLENNGINSNVSEHFGSAPVFMIINTNTLECKAVTNKNQHHSHGMCQPLATLGSEKFDGIVVGSIGAGALNKLNASGIKVYKTEYATIKETIDAVNKNELKEVMPQSACSHH